MRIIDFHTHAFPDALAEQTVPKLCARAKVTAALDGKVSSLVAEMDRLGIEAAVVLTIATKPSQFESILTWCTGVASKRLIPFASVHPDDPEAVQKIDRIHEAGLKGIKLHPYYQSFVFNDRCMFPLYERIEQRGLILLAHTGFDLGYPHDRIADPPKLMDVISAFPALKLITTHIGAWQDWDSVEKHMLGRPVYMEISYSFPFIGMQRARRFLRAHPPDLILFGSDSPWGSQEKILEDLLSLQLGDELNQRICFDNAARLLDLS
ncbi:MAG: amidohydrolase family protein [Spirochaetaceae bacterium]|nr:MAG: amidohydrolase family protein [Spirochaetaceae bacterium]